MNKLHLLAAAVAVALASTLAFAQTATAPKAPQAKIDSNGDGLVDRAEAAKFPRLAGKFDQLDTNKDGRLDASERQAHRGGGKRMQRGMHPGMHGMHRGMGMARMDADGDGRVSKAEARAGAERFSERFDAMDANKDGYLDRTDMQARMVERRAAFFAGADANKDGRLTRDEFAAHRTAQSSQRREAMQQRASAAGKTLPTAAERAQRMASAFDRIDANKDGSISKAEFDAFKPMRGDGKRKPAPTAR